MPAMDVTAAFFILLGVAFSLPLVVWAIGKLRPTKAVNTAARTT